MCTAVFAFVSTRSDRIRSNRARQWPATDNYEAQIRAAVESILLERCGTLDRCQVVLEDIMWHDVDSCAAGFEKAARAATEMAFVM